MKWNFKNRIKSFVIRFKKSQNLIWLSRFDKISSRLWYKLSYSAPTIQNYKFFERNHGRLMKVIQTKNENITSSKSLLFSNLYFFNRYSIKVIDN